MLKLRRFSLQIAHSFEHLFIQNDGRFFSLFLRLVSSFYNTLSICPYSAMHALFSPDFDNIRLKMLSLRLRHFREILLKKYQTTTKCGKLFTKIYIWPVLLWIVFIYIAVEMWMWIKFLGNIKVLRSKMRSFFRYLFKSSRTEEKNV